LAPEVKGAGRLSLAVAAAAVMVHLGALWNRFAFDDVPIVVLNPLVHTTAGIWRAFLEPYWPPDFGGAMYRPIAISSFAVDWLTGSVAWFHGMNLLWHAGVSVTVALLARRWAGDRAGLVAGLLFAVHPVHVEAVANVVGRSELMAALFTLLAVYAALERQRVGWSAVAIAAGLLSKENAAVAPGLIAWAWIARVSPPPPRRRLAVFVASWLVLGGAYLAVRWAVLGPYARFQGAAPVFVFESPLAVRLTAVAALADILRLLVFPLTLRADYSPDERTAVLSLADPRFGLGLIAIAVWAGCLVLAWRRGRRVEAYGLGWMGIAFLPVANLLFPTGVLVAERTLYLPSVGLVLAAGASLGDLAARRLGVILAVLALAGGVRTALRVPVWRDETTVTLSILEDSPRSYRGPARMQGIYLATGRPSQALEAGRKALEIFDKDARVYIATAAAEFTVGRPAAADSLLQRMERLCEACVGYYRFEASRAWARGDSAAADSLIARARVLRAPP
jgi:protein O-mannosyl-transferase